MKTIVGNIMPEETRMAIIEDGVFRDFAVERNDETHIVNHIYKGTIQNILPAMQAAFINIGRRKMPLSILVIFFPVLRQRKKSSKRRFRLVRASWFKSLRKNREQRAQKSRPMSALPVATPCSCRQSIILVYPKNSR